MKKNIIGLLCIGMVLCSGCGSAQQTSSSEKITSAVAEETTTTTISETTTTTTSKSTTTTSKSLSSTTTTTTSTDNPYVSIVDVTTDDGTHLQIVTADYSIYTCIIDFGTDDVQANIAGYLNICNDLISKNNYNADGYMFYGTENKGKDNEETVIFECYAKNTEGEFTYTMGNIVDRYKDALI